MTKAKGVVGGCARESLVSNARPSTTGGGGASYSAARPTTSGGIGQGGVCYGARPTTVGSCQGRTARAPNKPAELPTVLPETAQVALPSGRPEFGVSAELPALSVCRLEAREELQRKLREYGDDPALADFTCPICWDTFWQPVRTVCGHAFCETCLLKAVFAQLGQEQPDVSCPYCRHPLHVDDVAADQALLTRIRQVLGERSREEEGGAERSPRRSQGRVCRGLVKSGLSTAASAPVGGAAALSQRPMTAPDPGLAVIASSSVGPTASSAAPPVAGGEAVRSRLPNPPRANTTGSLGSSAGPARSVDFVVGWAQVQKPPGTAPPSVSRSSMRVASPICSPALPRGFRGEQQSGSGGCGGDNGGRASAHVGRQSPQPPQVAALEELGQGREHKTFPQRAGTDDLVVGATPSAGGSASRTRRQISASSMSPDKAKPTQEDQRHAPLTLRQQGRPSAPVRPSMGAPLPPQGIPLPMVVSSSPCGSPKSAGSCGSELGGLPGSSLLGIVAAGDAGLSPARGDRHTLTGLATATAAASAAAASASVAAVAAAATSYAADFAFADRYRRLLADGA